MTCFEGIYRGRKVLVTGHTGFKGSWLCLWLQKLGAQVTGYSLAPPTQPNHFELLKLDMDSVIGDVRDRQIINNTIARVKPEIVFHLAAQPLVRKSYQEPIETFTTNVIGTANVLDACRIVENLRAFVSVTSDKVYENRESLIPYREEDRLGGSDPYSASKSCVEQVTACYRHSFFSMNDFGKTHQMLIASARAGNVIGGGDWAEDRLIPDAMKATSRGIAVRIRNPHSVRPWQHVLEPLSGYLQLGTQLLMGKQEFAKAWNFGPDSEGNIEVARVIECLEKAWPAVRSEKTVNQNEPHETKVLKLDSSQAVSQLSWRPLWNWEIAVSRSARWYLKYYAEKEITSLEDLQEYEETAQRNAVAWSVR